MTIAGAHRHDLFGFWGWRSPGWEIFLLDSSQWISRTRTLYCRISQISSLFFLHYFGALFIYFSWWKRTVNIRHIPQHWHHEQQHPWCRYKHSRYKYKYQRNAIQQVKKNQYVEIAPISLKQWATGNELPMVYRPQNGVETWTANNGTYFATRRRHFLCFYICDSITVFLAV